MHLTQKAPNRATVDGEIFGLDTNYSRFQVLGTVGHSKTLLCGGDQLVDRPELEWPIHIVQERPEVKPIILR